MALRRPALRPLPVEDGGAADDEEDGDEQVIRRYAEGHVEYDLFVVQLDGPDGTPDVGYMVL
jgi:hypothetical protein